MASGTPHAAPPESDENAGTPAVPAKKSRIRACNLNMTILHQLLTITPVVKHSRTKASGSASMGIWSTARKAPTFNAISLDR